MARGKHKLEEDSEHLLKFCRRLLGSKQRALGDPGRCLPARVSHLVQEEGSLPGDRSGNCHGWTVLPHVSHVGGGAKPCRVGSTCGGAGEVQCGVRRTLSVMEGLRDAAWAGVGRKPAGAQSHRVAPYGEAYGPKSVGVTLKRIVGALRGQWEERACHLEPGASGWSCHREGPVPISSMRSRTIPIYCSLASVGESPSTCSPCPPPPAGRLNHSSYLPVAVLPVPPTD